MRHTIGHGAWSLLVGILLAACGGPSSTQPPPGALPACEEEGEAYDARRCEEQRGHPIGEDRTGGVPEGNAPGMDDDCEEVEGRRCPEQGSQPMRPNFGGPIPEGNAPGLEDPADGEEEGGAD